MKEAAEQPRSRHQQVLYDVIFKSDTPAGKAFDEVLIVCILLSVGVVLLDSVREYREEYGGILYVLEWFFTVLFTVEYLLRLYCVRERLRYAMSFFGVVDLLAILPTYFGLLLPGAHYLMVIRILRVLRIFRVLKMAHHVRQADLIIDALTASRRKILVFLSAVLTLVVIIGAVMYLVEGDADEAQGFRNIPISIYWAVVTLTTVGYGDISPETPVGQGLAVVVMLLGYSIIAVPTGIVTSHIMQSPRGGDSGKQCPSCGLFKHDDDARFCKRCGHVLKAQKEG